MPSKLLRSALKTLPQSGWGILVQFGAWLKSYRGTAGNSADGKKILRNVLVEAHLVGDIGFDDSTELSAFLRCCADTFPSASESEERYLCYKEACARFVGRGLRVRSEHLPDRLLRYCTSGRLLRRLAQEQLGFVARTEVDLRNPEKVFDDLRRKWNPSKIKTAKLGPRPSVFATFEQNFTAPLNRNDPVAVSKALCLSFPERLPTGEGILFEFSYPRDAVRNPRFPTVADAGWDSSFHPAGDRAPDLTDRRTLWGWTRPVTPYPPQPEIIHSNATLDILKEEPRLVGRIS